MATIFPPLVQPLGIVAATWTASAYMAYANKVLIIGSPLNTFPIPAGTELTINIGTDVPFGPMVVVFGGEVNTAAVVATINAAAVIAGVPGGIIATDITLNGGILLFDPSGSTAQRIKTEYTGATPAVDWAYIQIPEVERVEGVVNAFLVPDPAVSCSVISDPIAIPPGANSLVVNFESLGQDPDFLSPISTIPLGVVFENAAGDGLPGFAADDITAQVLLIPLPFDPLYDGAPSPDFETYGVSVFNTIWSGRLLRSSFKLTDVAGFGGPVLSFYLRTTGRLPFGIPPGYDFVRLVAGPMVNNAVALPGTAGQRIPLRFSANLQFGATP